MKKRVSFASVAFIVFVTFVCSSQAFAEESSEWIKRSDIPEARTGSASAVVDGKIYVFGGSSGSNAAYTGIKHDNTYEYDPSTDTWTEKKNMLTARSGVSAAVIDSKIYVVRGYFTTVGKLTRANKVEIYDPKTDSWENSRICLQLDRGLL
ncbi:hypothetical protein M3650_11340 [Paenibacillus sp. MER TA 81-3]|uniref:Kelch repeat-containing protein n=1 Tax=Paenibacillus sp. MER TA 81-3 TaxID=2939573 RepID=UPI00203DEBC6|nr:kelch repeat-containing protein [Paenibacillus sp. MER TA 81-3]MCM3339216.1 hypothetical protein [Paenibacillus sp. MER TA 81-3]